MMKNSLTILTVALILATSGWQRPAIAQESTGQSRTTTLFDGESLSGWAGDDRFWRVEDGAIVGQTTQDNPTDKNTFLIWQGGEVSDFELRFEYSMEGGNSGVQVRSQVVDGFRVHGYQADFDANNSYTGIWYDEGGRGILARRGRKVTIDRQGRRSATTGPVDEATYLAGLRKGDWNEVVITARGDTLTHSINGHVSAILVDQQEDAAEASGILALQLHAGPPMTIRFRKIELTTPVSDPPERP
jgi:hypothetical protein